MPRPFAALLLCMTWSSIAWGGGALDRFEGAHRPEPSRDSSSSNSSSSSSDDSSSSNDSSDSDSSSSSSYTSSSSSSSSSGEGTSISDPRVLLIPLCFVPPFPFACMHPSHRLNVDPYDDQLYLRPTPDDEAALLNTGSYRSKDVDRTRHAEIAIDGFGAFNESRVYSHTLDVTVWPTVFTIHASWEHFYEVLPEGGLDHLDMFRAHFGGNVLGPFVPFAELYLLAGASMLHGEDWTPAFDGGGDLRLYPHSPLLLEIAAMVSIYEIGPALLDATFRMGVAIDRFEIAAGPRWLYQGDAQGFWGPSATVSARF